MSDLNPIQRATIEIKYADGKIMRVEFRGDPAEPIVGTVDIETEPVEGPYDGTYRRFVPGPMRGVVHLRGLVAHAERATPGAPTPANARQIVAQAFLDERGVFEYVAAKRVLNALVEAGHLPSAYASREHEDA